MPPTTWAHSSRASCGRPAMKSRTSVKRLLASPMNVAASKKNDACWRNSIIRRAPESGGPSSMSRSSSIERFASLLTIASTVTNRATGSLAGNASPIFSNLIVGME